MMPKSKNKFCLTFLILIASFQTAVPIASRGQISDQNAKSVASQSAPKIILMATATGNNRITLSWNGPGALRYNVYRSAFSGGPYVLAARNVAKPAVSSGATNFFHWSDSSGLLPTGNYFYVVRGVQAGVEISQSNEVGDKLRFAIELDSGTAGDNKFFLYWNGIAGASGYNIYRRIDITDPYVLAAKNVTTRDPNQAGHFQSLVRAWTKTRAGYFGYTYVVRAVQNKTETIQSNETGNPDPEIDFYQENAHQTRLHSSRISLAVAATGSHKNTLFWTRIKKASSYNIYRSRSETGHYRRIASRVTTPDHNPGVVDKFLFSDTNLPRGVTLFYVVKAVRHGREIARSGIEYEDAGSVVIPWDTGNSARILKAEREILRGALDPDTDLRTGKSVPAEVGLLSIQGPDGAVYNDLLKPIRRNSKNPLSVGR